MQVIHINGVQTSEPEARANTESLSLAYGNAHNEKLIRYITAYNPTQGGLLDVVDALQAKTTEYPGATYVMLLRAMLFNQVTAPVTQALAAELQKLLIDRTYCPTSASHVFDRESFRVNCSKHLS